MQKGIYIHDMEDNSEVSGTYLIADSRFLMTKGGKPFWNIALSDRTGKIDAKIWHPLCLSFETMEPGQLVYLEGITNRFNDCLQVIIEKLEILNPENIDSEILRDFMPKGPNDPEDMFRELKLLCLDEFKNPGWRKLVVSVLHDTAIMDKFIYFPAAKKMHQAYLGGLLEHTLGVFKICREIANMHPELDRQALLCGALFHDIGKIREFSGGIINDYTDEGSLIGHISLGVEILYPFLAKSGLEEGLKQHLIHLILSHHGEYEFGAPRLPQTAEAFVLHYADNLDAKLAQCKTAIMNMEQGEWSEYQKPLSRSIFYPFRTPAKSNRKTTQEEECLSLLKE